MGSPYYYAVEIPVRAHQIITDFWKMIEAKPYTQFGGPLATTFLVAMAGPMINFPYERLYRPDGAKDERNIHVKTTEDFDAMIGANPLSTTPFFGKDAWRYTYVADPDLRVVEMRPEVLDALINSNSVAEAAKIDVHTWFSCLRHALAHSAIAYLNKDGKQVAHAPTEMIAFVSEHRVKRNHIGSHVFRISRADFREFLDVWAEWLQG